MQSSVPCMNLCTGGEGGGGGTPPNELPNDVPNDRKSRQISLRGGKQGGLVSVKRVKTTKNYYLRAKRGGLLCGKLLKTTKNDDAPSKARSAGVLFQCTQGWPPPSSRSRRRTPPARNHLKYILEVIPLLSCTPRRHASLAIHPESPIWRGFR